MGHTDRILQHAFWREHEELERQRSPHPLITVQSVAMLSSRVLGRWPHLTAIDIYSSRWVALRVATRGLDEDVGLFDLTQDRAIMWELVGYRRWLEVIPFHPLSIGQGRRGEISRATLWAYDGQGTVITTEWDLATGQSKDYIGEGYDENELAESPYVFASLPASGQPVGAMDITPGLRWHPLPDGWMLFVEIENSSELRRLQAHATAITLAAVTPDGRSILTLAQDGEVKVWHAQPTPVIMSAAPASNGSTT